MTDICIWLNKVLEWVDRCGPPAIPYIGKAPRGYRNQPAPHMEIAYLLEKGVENLSIGDRVVSAPPFHLTLHNVHQGNYTPTMERFYSWCLFLDVGSEETFSELRSKPLFCSAPLPPNEEVYAAYERLGSACVRYGSGSLAYDASGSAFTPAPGHPSAGFPGTIRIKAALLDLLGLLLYSVGPATGSALHPLPVQRAIEFMSLRYRDPSLRLPQVSRSAGLSLDHFGRLFRQHTGETPMHHLNAIRIRQARYLLEHTELLVEEVAADVGFLNPFHFSRVFKQYTGLSPLNYRRQHD